MRAGAVAAEPPLLHALKHDLGGDIQLQRVVGVPLARVVVRLGIAEAKFLVGPGIVLAPRELDEASPAIGLAGLGIFLAVGLASSAAVLLDRLHGKASLMGRGR